MDWRWLLFSLVAAAIAAVRLRRRPPRAGAGRELPPTDPAAGSQPGPDATTHAGTDERTGRTSERERDADAEPPPAAALGGAPDRSLDRSLDQALDTGDTGDTGDTVDTVGPEALDAALERVWAEHAGDAGTLLAARLRLLVHRGVPARALRPAPGARTVRVVFADGTVVLCRGTGQGDFGRLGLAMLHHSVRLGSFRSASDGTRLEFRWHPDQRLAAVAVGLDQPD